MVSSVSHVLQIVKATSNQKHVAKLFTFKLTFVHNETTVGIVEIFDAGEHHNINYISFRIEAAPSLKLQASHVNHLRISDYQIYRY